MAKKDAEGELLSDFVERFRFVAALLARFGTPEKMRDLVESVQVGDGLRFAKLLDGLPFPPGFPPRTPCIWIREIVKKVLERPIMETVMVMKSLDNFPAGERLQKERQFFRCFAACRFDPGCDSSTRTGPGGEIIVPPGPYRDCLEAAGLVEFKDIVVGYEQLIYYESTKDVTQLCPFI